MTVPGTATAGGHTNTGCGKPLGMEEYTAGLEGCDCNNGEVGRDLDP